MPDDATLDAKLARLRDPDRPPNRWLRRPWRKDWIFWLWMVALVAGGWNVVQQAFWFNPVTQEYQLWFGYSAQAFILDLAFVGAGQTLIWMGIPAVIRKSYRSWQRGKLEGARA